MNINWFEVRPSTNIAEGFWAQIRSGRSKCLESKTGFWIVFQGMSQNGIIVFFSYSLFDETCLVVELAPAKGGKIGEKENTWNWKEKSGRPTYLAGGWHRKSILNVSWQENGR